MADLDAAFAQKVLNVAQRQQVPNVDHHREVDDDKQGFEVSEGAVL